MSSPSVKTATEKARNLNLMRLDVVSSTVAFYIHHSDMAVVGFPALTRLIASTPDVSLVIIPGINPSQKHTVHLEAKWYVLTKRPVKWE